MTLMLALAWAAATALIRVGPNRYHWPVVWGLIGLGVPLAGWITFQMGPMVGMFALIGGVAALRQPVRGLMQPGLSEGPTET